MAKVKTAKKKRPLKVRIKRNLVTATTLLLILYIGVHVITRTDGFRTLVADKLSNGTRQLITLEKCGATPLLGLHLQGLGFEGAVIPDAKVLFNWHGPLYKDVPLVRRLIIANLDIEFRRIPTSGNWEPLVLNGVGARLGAILGLNPATMDENDALPKFPAYAINEKTLVQLRRAKLVWRDEKGRELAYITEADLNVKSGTLIKRKVIQTIAKCGHVKLASGRAMRDFRLEVFRIEGSGVATILDMADSNGEYPEFATENLWQDLNLNLHQLSEHR
ncbi:hypothetical protein PDESU_05788 [Pontiella desulfatans]|uniref:Uncharacterized protein n=1 Tax=Pontiella desulfatans TaxID=2750659 RepID=A0A6C2UBF2_PONDE|nr:hypothetical protein [Pontiella desulfatans]VGO17193.1 hypothetical protein PDESU_05788 [Pontiella desulfatans]